MVIFIGGSVFKACDKYLTMKVLTENGEALNLANLPGDITATRHLCVFDPKLSDFTFQPIVFTEVFRSKPSLVRIGDHNVWLPSNWSVLAYDYLTGDVEAVPLIEAHKFEVLTFHPLKSSRHHGQPMEVEHGSANVQWTMPRVLGDVAIAMPVGDSCIYVIKHGTGWDALHIADMV